MILPDVQSIMEIAIVSHPGAAKFREPVDVVRIQIPEVCKFSFGFFRPDLTAEHPLSHFGIFPWIESHLLGNFSQPKSIGNDRRKNSGPKILHELQLSLGEPGTGGYHSAPHFSRSVVKAKPPRKHSKTGCY